MNKTCSLLSLSNEFLSFTVWGVNFSIWVRIEEDNSLSFSLTIVHRKNFGMNINKVYYLFHTSHNFHYNWIFVTRKKTLADFKCFHTEMEGITIIYLWYIYFFKRLNWYITTTKKSSNTRCAKEDLKSSNYKLDNEKTKQKQGTSRS